MNAIPMTDPWVDNIYKVEFNADPIKFFEKIKRLLTEDKKKEKRVVELLKQYENAEISVGKIAEKLNVTRDDVLNLMEEHNVYLVDYDFSEDEKTIEKYLIK
jgi:DNA-directed RNA polymerase specialized sigma subunit